MTQGVENRLLRMFLLVTAVGAVHMAEQMMFGIEEYLMLRDQMGRWHGLFASTWQDEASVLMITIVFLLVSMMVYGALRGGRAALFVLLAFGLLGVGEAHHWIQAVLERRYDPGLVTSFAYVWMGWMIVRRTTVLLWPQMRGIESGYAWLALKVK